MHPLRCVIATTALALSLIASAQSVTASDIGRRDATVLAVDDSTETVDSGDRTNLFKIPVTDGVALGASEMAMLIAAGNETTEISDGDADGVALAASRLMALGTVPSGDMPCNRGTKSVQVLFGLSNCLTEDEMTSIMMDIDSAIATASSNKFFFDDNAIDRDFFWGTYFDPHCTGNAWPRYVGSLQYFTNIYGNVDLYVNVAKDMGAISEQYTHLSLQIYKTLETRVCAGALCPVSASDVNVASADAYKDTAPAITRAMYCPAAAGANPTTYTSDDNKKQCSCRCAGDKVLVSGVCMCPGELEAIAGGDTCGCTNGRTKTADNKCICTGGRTNSATTSACVCQPGYTYDGTVCVRDCFWLAGNAGSVCPWSDPLKTFLTLLTDCQIVAPVPQDNYVGDKRTNKFDPTSPAAYGSPSNDPKITISAAKTGIATDTKSTSWLNYALSPGTLEDNVHLTTFGVFDLSLVASDYRGHAQCVGCVAVQDTFPPTPTNPCGLDTTTTVVHNDYSVAKLGEYVAAEDTFTNFYANVQNNGAENAAGDNKRADVESTTLVDFFNTAVPSATLATRCFTDNYVSELLNSASTMTLDAVSAVARSADKSSLVCERCCTKHKVLKEEWYPYTCATPNPPKQVQGTAECNLNRCLKTQPTTLLSATFGIAGDAAGKTTTTINGLPAGTVGTTGTNYIHRSVTCKTWAEACTVGVTLENLFTKTADWKPTAAVPPTYDAANFVTYIYKVGAGGSWAAWNDATELTFSGEETEVYVQAWSRCGLIQENMFVFKIHLHSSRDVCKDFQQRWVDNSPTPRTAPNDISATCAYPGSDFALLTFNYDSSENVPHEAGKVKGKYTNLVCTLVAEDAAPTVVTTGVDMTPSFGLADPKPTPFTIAKQFAVELMKEPTTSKNTHVSISCVFTFQYFDTSTTTTDTCSASFVFTDCDLPTVDTASESVQCLPRDCGGPNALPGAFETCNGDVFTTAVVGGVSTTQTKPPTDACCAACSSALQCAAVSGTSSVKRCVPTPALVLAALAMDETDRVVRSVMEAETEAQPLSSSTMALLMGATAMVAVVALVVAKTRAKKKQQTVADDAYVSLLD